MQAFDTTDAYVSFSAEHRDRPLDLTRHVDLDRIEAAVPFPPYKSKAARWTYGAIIADVSYAADAHPGVRTSYSRRWGFYSERRRYMHPNVGSGPVVVSCMDALVDRGILVMHDKRPPSSGGSGVQSSVLPSPSLAGLDLGRGRRRFVEPIQLKDSSGELTDYAETSRTRAERKFLEKINKTIAGSEIELRSPNAVVQPNGLIRFPGHSVDGEANALFRVFNGGWTLGGRYYGGYWQGVPKGDRKHFFIDGQTVVEEDFPQIHAAITYAMAGERKEGDAYEIAGWDRNLCKRAFNILINASCWASAHGALKQHCDHEAARQLIEAMKAKHPLIRRFFHTGLGLKMQNFDAAMCRKVLDRMTLKHGAVCLPIHDSFIVQERWRDALVIAMQEAWDEVMATIPRQ